MWRGSKMMIDFNLEWVSFRKDENIWWQLKIKKFNNKHQPLTYSHYFSWVARERRRSWIYGKHIPTHYLLPYLSVIVFGFLWPGNEGGNGGSKSHRYSVTDIWSVLNIIILSPRTYNIIMPYISGTNFECGSIGPIIIFVNLFSYVLIACQFFLKAIWKFNMIAEMFKMQPL